MKVIMKKIYYKVFGFEMPDNIGHGGIMKIIKYINGYGYSVEIRDCDNITIYLNGDGLMVGNPDYDHRLDGKDYDELTDIECIIKAIGFFADFYFSNKMVAVSEFLKS